MALVGEGDGSWSYPWAVPAPRDDWSLKRSGMASPLGGVPELGRRASLGCWWAPARTGSIPVTPTKFPNESISVIRNLSHGTIAAPIASYAPRNTIAWNATC